MSPAARSAGSVVASARRPGQGDGGHPEAQAQAEHDSIRSGIGGRNRRRPGQERVQRPEQRGDGDEGKEESAEVPGTDAGPGQGRPALPR